LPRLIELGAEDRLDCQLPQRSPADAVAFTSWTPQRIVIEQAMSPTSKSQTLVHELAHAQRAAESPGGDPVIELRQRGARRGALRIYGASLTWDPSDANSIPYLAVCGRAPPI